MPWAPLIKTRPALELSTSTARASTAACASAVRQRITNTSAREVMEGVLQRAHRRRRLTSRSASAPHSIFTLG